MSRFKDASGNEWELRITVGQLDRLKAAGLDLDALTAEKAELFSVLMLPRRVLGSVLWILCEKQVRDTDPEKFFGGFDGDTLEAAGRALLDAVLDFFPRLATAPIKKGLPQILAAMEAAGDREMERRISGLSPGGSPGRSESTPAT
jgi:hypothetical protein